MMALPKWVPSTPEVAREVVIVLVGALVATVLVKGMPPSLRQWFTFNDPPPPPSSF